MEHGHSIEEIQRRLTKPKSSGNLRDFVFGSIDGTVTTFAIVSGVEGAQLSSSIIVILGIANILADGFSMAAGNYSATKAELDDVIRIREMEERHIHLEPEGEREEVRQILSNKGLAGDVLENAVDAITRNRRTWIDLMLVEEHGVLPNAHHPMRAALVTFAAFVFCGMIPLLPYVLSFDRPFEATIAATAIVFFTVGALKSRWSLQRWWWSGLETLAIGAVAASVAYGVGAYFAH